MSLIALPFVWSFLEVTAPPPSPPAPPPPVAHTAPTRRWGVETGPLWFAVGNFIRPKLTWTAWSRDDLAGDVLVAPLFRVPQDRDDGEIFEVGVELGYRQYLWRGLNLEASALVMRSRVDSTADGMRYVGLNVFIAATAGWRFDFSVGRSTLYFLPQIGAGRDVVRTDPPPTSVHLTLVGELLVGIRF
jgi:hypothetical protein